MNTARGTPEEIERANQEYIEALTKSMEATEKLIKLLEQQEPTIEIRKEYKNAWNCHNIDRIKLLIAKGELPERKEKSRKIRW